MKPHARRLSLFVVALLTLVCIFTVVFENYDADSSSTHAAPGSFSHAPLDSPVAVGDGKKSDRPLVVVVEDHHAGAATLEESAYARSGAASTMDDSRNKLEREAHKQGVSKLLSATTANAAERSSSSPTTEQRSANNPRIHFFLQRFPLIFFNLTKWMFPSSSWGFREGQAQQHGFPLSDSSSTAAVEPSSFFGELKKDGPNNQAMSASVTVMSPNFESHVGDKTTTIKKKEYKVVCADTMQPTALINTTTTTSSSSNKQRTAMSTLFEKEFTQFIGAATITKSQNGFLGENVCVPLWGFIHGFISSSRSKDGKSGGGAKKGKESLKKRADSGLQLKMQTEMRTTVKDFMFSSWQSLFFSDAGGGKRSSYSEEDRDEEERRGSVYCAMREELQENAERSSSRKKRRRNVVVIHPVRQHFNNVYHIVLRLAATLSFMKRRAHAVPTTLQEEEEANNNSTTIQQETRSSSSVVAQQLRDFIDDMSSAARHSYYSERGLISCEDQVHGLPPRLQQFKCSSDATSSSENCGVKMAFVLTRPAVTTDPDVAYSAKRNIYRKLFQAIAPRRCVTRNATQKSRSKSRAAIVDDGEPWFSTVGIPRSPLPPPSSSSVAKSGQQGSSTQKEDTTQDGFRFRNATSKFEVEVGSDLAKGIQRHQYSEQPKEEREAPSPSATRGSSNTSSSLSLSPFSAMCFDDAIIGWDKFPMMGPFSDDMKVAFRTYRRALLAYYYPHNYFKATIDKRKQLEEAVLRKESVQLVSPRVVPTPRLQTHLDADRVFFDALPASLFPQCATTQEEKDATSSHFVVHVLVIVRKDNRRILNHDVVIETLKAQGTFFFPLPKSYQSLESNAESSSSSVQAGVCAKLEIKIIEPEVLSMAEQIEAAAEADIVMAVNGAALTLASFQKLCYPHCVWIEINPPTKAYAGWSGWNNNPKGVFGALMTLGGIGHHLAWKQPLHTRCHVVYKKQMNITEGERKANTTGAVGGTTYDEDCVTLTRKDTPRSLHEYPPGMFRKQRDVPPPPSLTIRFDIKVNTTDMLTTMRSAVCLNVVRGRWATKWVLNPNGTTDINNHQEEALEGDDDSERTEKRKQLSMAMKPQLDALCDVVVP